MLNGVSQLRRTIWRTIDAYMGKLCLSGHPSHGCEPVCGPYQFRTRAMPRALRGLPSGVAKGHCRMVDKCTVKSVQWQGASATSYNFVAT